ncbi:MULTISPECIES: dihydrofolate reductase [unclassified Bosea (in: a-proteobacteria)]|uniref:dihydrofolate reductase n=1 Tax=unclassified Bosea (in: a-proteobacteria) TaxID=2653178 RepID=UPI000F752709|nr:MULTISPECIES: dihydrofolate reductase [unclassified Bosea (in: a-proteobacteria)]AZO76466.1 diacylglycerol kinase [Bosea sp. Tri-49]RXT26393.1 diacylglycerol kinase [Bosea sp. Tri-39]RXT31633.1 diacylglycerol kinase [Bosea sp. Tri-54]
MAKLPIVLIAAIAENGVIGRDNQLIWRLKTDMRRFRELTMGCPIIMGRKTFLSIGKPLPGRQTVVLSRDPDFQPEGVYIVPSLDQALATGQGLGKAMGARAVIVAGGGEVYAQALPVVDRLELTLVHARPEGDAVFPDFDRAVFHESTRSEHPAGADDEFSFAFATFERVS